MTTYDDSNIFAKIIRGDIPAIKLYEDENTLAIMDIMPESKGHCLVIPKAPSRNLLDASDQALAAAMPVVRKLANAAKTAFAADGVRVIQYNEAPAGQTVFHLHIHIIPIYEGVALKKHAMGEVDQETIKADAEAIRAALD
ncbi:histidine triad (HIT) family protein [Fulvimarina manganoxydans]|uniref:Histidine triad (HIT) family protein n=1 Tax=Fulvimarina manganoxydans TaxID=937218 RepID=A0A1W1YLL5_9HYPH|nr:HIT domain-containing protein [Fulvimarina manganoxydans]SMC36691.1 histidine triad (HIT) family protein [Fulvimarina manganoxydans]